MKLTKIRIKNFRGYKDSVEINIGDLTAFVGKNDIGKSTVLEALDIFFNEGKGVARIDKEDINKQCLTTGCIDIEIAVCFSELPNRLIIDASNETELTEEYLVNRLGELEVIKRFPNAGREKVFLNCYHPSNTECSNLHLKKDSELRTIISSKSIACGDLSRNAVMRKSIWSHFSHTLDLTDTEIEVTKGEVKPIWEKIQSYLPSFTLFQSDRKNSDNDSEVQDPLKEAVKQILNDPGIIASLSAVADEVNHRLSEVSRDTLDKLREMNPEIANSLVPVIPTMESLKWVDVFKNVAISSDDGIMINKRGSGVRRLILLNFLRAEAERRMRSSNATGIIYAIEEPETAQHIKHQQKLIDALIVLSGAQNTQVIITTHSSSIVKKLDYSHIRLIKENAGLKIVENVEPGQLPYPSLNEVSFLAFSEATDEYHNELYGYIESEGLLSQYKTGKPQISYIKIHRGTRNVINIIETEYIRHQIHHPENTLNTRFTHEQLLSSVSAMREFIRRERP